MDRQTWLVGVRCTILERAKITEAARARGTSFSVYFREAALAATEREHTQRALGGSGDTPVKADGGDEKTVDAPPEWV